MTKRWRRVHIPRGPAPPIHTRARTAIAIVLSIIFIEIVIALGANAFTAFVAGVVSGAVFLDIAMKWGR